MGASRIARTRVREESGGRAAVLSLTDPFGYRITHQQECSEAFIGLD
jgi:hypothetical protein